MTLYELIRELRLILLHEAPNRLHSSTITDRDHPDEGGMGPPFTERFMRYIGHPSHWGQSRIGMLSIMEAVAPWCARLHTSHTSSGFAGTLCSQMVWEACYISQEPADIAWKHNLPVEQVERMLTNALKEAWEWRVRRERHVMRMDDGKAPRPLEEPLPYERVVRSTLPHMEPTA